jgi:hypothetical protein
VATSFCLTADEHTCRLTFRPSRREATEPTGSTRVIRNGWTIPTSDPPRRGCGDPPAPQPSPPVVLAPNARATFASAPTVSSERVLHAATELDARAIGRLETPRIRGVVVELDPTLLGRPWVGEIRHAHVVAYLAAALAAEVGRRTFGRSLWPVTTISTLPSRMVSCEVMFRSAPKSRPSGTSCTTRIDMRRRYRGDWTDVTG